jgi:hypothetical protein
MMLRPDTVPGHSATAAVKSTVMKARSPNDNITKRRRVSTLLASLEMFRQMGALENGIRNLFIYVLLFDENEA